MQPLFFALLCATSITTSPANEDLVSSPEFQSFRDRTPLIQLKSTAGSGDFLVVDTLAAEELQQAEERLAHAELKAIEERLARIVVDHPTTSAAAKAKNTLAKAGLKVTDDGRVIEDHVFVFTVPFNRNTVQKVAGTLRVPFAVNQKALLFGGCGTWNVPATLLH